MRCSWSSAYGQKLFSTKLARMLLYKDSRRDLATR